MDFDKYMDDIILFTNNACSMLNDVKELFDSWFEEISNNFYIIKTYTEDIENKEIELDKHYEKVKRIIGEQNKVLEEKQIESEMTECEYKNIYNELLLLSREYEKQKQILLDYQKKLELTPHDKRVLSVARERLNLYRDITNVVWDYSVPIDSAATGYARNKNKIYAHAFEYEKSKLTYQELLNNMWKEIENSTDGGEWSDIISEYSMENKENVNKN